MKLIHILLFCFFIQAGAAYAQEDDQTYARALQLYYTGSYKLAEPVFTEAIAKNPANGNAYLYRGNCYVNLHRLREAKSDYDKAGKTLKNSPELEFGFGYLYNEKGEYKKAIPYLDKAILLDPKYALAYNTRGVSYQSLGKPRLAIDDYTMAINADSTLALAYNNRGTAIYENQDIAKATNLDIRNAIKDFDHAVELDPGLCVARRNRGMAYGFLNKNDLALIDLDAAIKCDETNASYYIIRGSHLTKIGQYTNAISDFKMALSIDPKLAEAEILMGDAYEKSGDVQQGVVCEMTAAIIDKGFRPLSNYNIARFYAIYKDKTLAMKYLKYAKKYGYFSSNENLANFLKDNAFLGLKTDKDFLKFREKVRGKRM